jgi:hypothetical protein
MATVIENARTEKVEAEPEIIRDAEFVRSHLDLLTQDVDALRQRLADFTSAVNVCGMDGSEPPAFCLAHELRKEPEAEVGERTQTER